MRDEPTLPDVPASAAIDYRPNRLGHDMGRYDITDPRAFAGDVVAAADVTDLADLAASPHWEDRVRAETLRQRIQVTLPDQFPCLYETADSPNRTRSATPRPHPWVVSPDIDMLTALLPDYQELWDGYTDQWGPSSRRTFAVGRLDGLSPRAVCRPGTTPEQVIAATMLTHTGMYRRAPERLRKLHPRYASWQVSA